LSRFKRLCDSLEKPPTLSNVIKEKAKRDDREDNRLKELLSGFKLPRSEKAVERSERAHKQMLNAMNKTSEWWSINLESDLGGGT